MKTASIAFAAILATTGATFADEYGALNTHLTYPHDSISQSQDAGAPVLKSKRFIDPAVTNSTVQDDRIELPRKLLEKSVLGSDRH